MSGNPNLTNIQGDLFSRGFPKIYETYYFFTIVTGQEHAFCEALAKLGKSDKVPHLQEVQKTWEEVDKQKPQGIIFDTSAFVIGFSRSGLDKIQLGCKKNLELDSLEKSDPAFYGGMAADQKNLNDPDYSTWDPLFKTSPIHGLLKIGGSSKSLVDACLSSIQGYLGFPLVIADIAALSEPTTVNSRADGNVRPKESKLNGVEHFGFEDSISQPLVKGIDSSPSLINDSGMITDQNVILVSIPAPPPQTTSKLLPKPDASKRPAWMVDGSFLAFRKLEQDVAAFQNFTQANFAKAFCSSADELAARMMGRWKSGAPTVTYRTADADSKATPPFKNDFGFTSKNVCPLAAHICKTNPRDGLPDTSHARMLRNGIPYGTEFTADPDGKRGMLFACYQSSIDNGFQFVQRTWANNPGFPASGAGMDPFSAQSNGAQLFITMWDKSPSTPPVSLNFSQFVTMKGGEYFFIPSISAISNDLGST